MNEKRLKLSNSISGGALPALFANPKSSVSSSDKLDGFGVAGKDVTRLDAAGQQISMDDSRKSEDVGRRRAGFGAGGGRRNSLKRREVAMEAIKANELDNEEAITKLNSFGYLDFYESSIENQKLGELRRKSKSLYRRLPQTQEWIEQQYYQLPLENQNADLVRANRFWKDYSRHTGGPFLSRYLSESHRTFTEMMFALAVMDLPEKAPDHKFEYADNSVKVTAAAPMVAMHQQFQPVVFKPRNTSVLVSENFYQKNDRYREEDGVKYDKFVTSPFYAHHLYGAQVVITNPTSTPQAIDLLVQVPNGSMATSGSQETRSLQLQLDAFSTKTFEYSFYFPTAGEFTHYPAHVTKDDEVLAFADQRSFEVIDEPRELDKSSWVYVSQNASEDEVIEFLNTNNVLSLDLKKIAFRMKNKAFFERTIDTLKKRCQYDHVLWSYALLHQIGDASAEFLRHENRIAHRVGKFLESDLLTVEPYHRNWYQHREYSPLINARTYKVNTKRQILNPAFHTQYHRLLEILSFRKQLTSEDHLVVTYYMLLQNRINEAMAHFGKVKKEDLNEEIQYDYCDAYLDFYLESPTDAKSKALKWKDYPVETWRSRFRSILAQVDEIQGDSGQGR